MTPLTAIRDQLLRDALNIGGPQAVAMSIANVMRRDGWEADDMISVADHIAAQAELQRVASLARDGRVTSTEELKQ